MSRLTHTFLIMAICLFFASSAFARQREMDAMFPSALNRAVDKTANEPINSRHHGTPTVLPQRNTLNSARIEADRARRNRSQATPSKNASYPSTRKSFGHVDKWPANQKPLELMPPTTRSHAVSMPARPLTPFPRAKAPFPRAQPPFAGELTPFPRHRLAKPTSTNVRPIQPEKFADDFGTVMTFPAAERAINSDVDNQNPNTSNRFGNISDSVRQPAIPSADALDQVGSLPQQVIRTTIIGPQTLVQDVPDLFEIEVTNASARTAKEIVVQMEVSEDLTITDFDRKAWLDGENRTVSWRIEGLQSGFKDVIRFRAVSATAGNHEQNITIGMENTFQGQTGFVAHVIQSPTSPTSQRPDSEK